MKNAIINIFSKINAFIKAHTVISIVVGAVVVTTAIATPIAIYVLKDEPADSSVPELDEKLEEQAKQEQEESLPSQAEQEVEEQTRQKTVDVTVKKEENTNQSENKPQQNTQSSEIKNDSSSIKFAHEGSNVIVEGIGLVPIREAYEKGYVRIKIIDGLAHLISTLNGVDFVYEADINTGISYDGESPIIYTYEDGTTGTEKRDGAKYEYLPGMYNTVYLNKDNAKRIHGSICSTCGKVVGSGINDTCAQSSFSQYCRYCSSSISPYICHSCVAGSYNEQGIYCIYCGKISGTGINGTCLRYWTVGEHVCINCGTTVPTNTCHTCTSGCMYCKKTMGNGSNGTCYREYFSQSNCPSCNVAVPKDTCHSCN